MRQWLARRYEFGHFEQFLTHMEDNKGYKNVKKNTPDFLKEMVETLATLSGERNHMREPLEAAFKLATTLRFLATGNSYAMQVCNSPTASE